MPLVVASMSVLLMIAVALNLLFFPALYPIARFFAARQAVVLDGFGAGGALSRSSTLSVGVKRHILGTVILAAILTLAISLGAMLAAEVFPGDVLKRITATLVGVVIRPFFSIVETLLYYDVRIRKEAFDIEYMAGGDSVLAPTNVAM